MNNGLFEKVYNPDVLSCLANLSNDEVFTPPSIANKMLDMLPQELFCNPDIRFLDPAAKSGVFLREIVKRLNKGLEHQIPDPFERLEHILKKQVFAIAITELTSLISRRSVYCSTYPNSEYSVVRFDNAEGNVRFKRINHSWRDGKCIFCGAAESRYNRGDEFETHAYEFIHNLNSEEIFNMKFDVIISNPPYQLSDGGGMGTSATPIYQKFVQTAKKLRPKYITMIIPSRWFSGGKGLDEFRDEMLHDLHIRNIVDYFNATDCFPGVDISGGVCFFLWDRENEGDCNIKSIRNGKSSVMTRPLLEKNAESFVRFNESIAILRKIQAFKESSFSSIVSTRKPFGLEANDAIYEQNSNNRYFVYAYPKSGFVDKNCIRCNFEKVNKYKVLISKAYGERGEFPYWVLGKPFIGEPNSVCTETYLVIGGSEDKETAENIRTYISTRFFRFFVLLKKNTQNAPKSVYQFVPLQDFTKPWTDEELYKKYSLTDEEINFIESMIKPMDTGGDNNVR